MVLLTLNTHSLVEENYNQKLDSFIKAVGQIRPDVIALQEVNQSRNGKAVSESVLKDYTPCQDGITVREDNHACSIAKATGYNWTWLPMKIGYGKFDEGLAVMSRSPILETDVFLISRRDDYSDWKTRKVLGVRTENGWFYSIHLSWWDDPDEPFLYQWNRLDGHLKERKNVWLMGDFNCPSDVKGEGYDKIRSDGWIDTFEKAQSRDSGYTVEEAIDGWKGKTARRMRIDYIWSRSDDEILRSEVIFDGKTYPKISDHFGVIIKTKRGESL